MRFDALGVQKGIPSCSWTCFVSPAWRLTAARFGPPVPVGGVPAKRSGVLFTQENRRKIEEANKKRIEENGTVPGEEDLTRHWTRSVRLGWHVLPSQL